MERLLTTPAEPDSFRELDRFLREPAPEPPGAPPPPRDAEPAQDAFDAQILAGLVSP